MNRRDALRAMGAMAGAATATRLLPGCGDDLAPPGIDRVVLVMMENRSYDHALGARALEGLGGDGLRADLGNAGLDGVIHAPYPAAGGAMCVPDPPHSWDAAHAAFGAGDNAGFVAAHQRRYGGMTSYAHPMQYLTRAHAPVTWALADQYAVCDRSFCSVMGPTWPNRLYWHTGTSGGLTINEVPPGGVDWTSIHHRLDEAGVAWRYYYSTLPVIALLTGLDKTGRVGVFENFLEEAQAGTLAPVTYLDPGFDVNDDHPPMHPAYAQQFLAAVYVALASSPLWHRTLLIITYDENGGFYDHVPPPTTVDERPGFAQMGFRVPTLVVGPYVRAGVSSVVRDHCSALAHLERMFNLPPLNARTAAANDYADVIDTARLRVGPDAPITVPAIELDEAALEADCARVDARLHEHPIHELAERYPTYFAGWDRRREFRDRLYAIGDFLERHNAGRIRRRSRRRR